VVGTDRHRTINQDVADRPAGEVYDGRGLTDQRDHFASTASW
jgi:hypothetical protein